MIHFRDLQFYMLVVFIAWKCELNKLIRAIFVVNCLILEDCIEVQESFTKLMKFQLNSPINTALEGRQQVSRLRVGSQWGETDKEKIVFQVLVLKRHSWRNGETRLRQEIIQESATSLLLSSQIKI